MWSRFIQGLKRRSSFRKRLHSFLLHTKVPVIVKVIIAVVLERKSVSDGSCGFVVIRQ